MDFFVLARCLFIGPNVIVICNNSKLKYRVEKLYSILFNFLKKYMRGIFMTKNKIAMVLIILFFINFCSKRDIKIADIKNINYKNVTQNYNIKLIKMRDIKLEFNKDNPLQWINAVNFDSKNNILIADKTSSNIKKYNHNGQLLGVVGRPGRGPGEFLNIHSFFIEKNSNKIIVCDSQTRQITYFDNNGNYEYSFKLNDNYFLTISSHPTFLANNNKIYIPVIYANAKDYDQEVSFFPIIELNKEGKIINSMGIYDEVYNDYNLQKFVNVKLAQKIYKNKLFYSQEGYYKINYLDLDNKNNNYKFGVKGKYYRKLKNYAKGNLNQLSKYICTTSSMKNPIIIKDKYLIIEYRNINKISANNKILYTNGKENEFDNYLQIYDIQNKEYLGEINLDRKIILNVDDEDYIYFMFPYNVDYLYKYDLEITERENRNEK